MKKRRLLSAFLAASLLCTMAPPATVLATETNAQAVDEQASARSDGLEIENGQEGTDYRLDGNVVTVLKDTSLTFGHIDSRHRVNVPENITADIHIESGHMIVQEIGTNSTINLSGEGDYDCILGTPDEPVNLEGTLSINETEENGRVQVSGSFGYDREQGNIVINGGNVLMGFYGSAWKLNDFTINHGNIDLIFQDYENRGVLNVKNFSVHGGNIEFDLSETPYQSVVGTERCTIDGGSIAVRDSVELTDNIFESEFTGIVGADAELEAINQFQYNALISAQQSNITSGTFYEGDLSTNKVYGCSVAPGKTLEVSRIKTDQNGNQYAVYSVAPEDTAEHLTVVSGSNYETSGNILTLKDNANVTVKTSGQTNDRILVENGAQATLTLDGVDMINSKSPICLGFSSKLTLILADNSTNTVKAIGELGYSGIETRSAANLVIRGKGTLNVYGTEGGAAIGTSEINQYGASITIEDGVIHAVGGDKAAGIGGGIDSSNVIINISGGTITAEGQTGIGDGAHSIYTFIHITGGDITARGNEGAGIGGGPGSVVSGISIEDGKIEANGASGIGTGEGLAVNDHTYNSMVEGIEIYGGQIYAEGNTGIGGGRADDGAITSVGRIIVHGGTIEAQGGNYGIGAGEGGAGGTLECIGAVITANSISDMAHQGSWRGLFFVDTINRGEGTLLGDYVSLGNDSIIERPFKIKNGQQLTIPEDVILTNLNSIEVQSGGSLVTNGTLNNEEGYIAIYPGGFFENNGDLLGDIDYIEEEPNYDDMYVTGVQLNKERMTLQPEKSKKLTATVLPETAENKNVTWSSSDTNVAKVNKNGRVTAVNEGTAIITVTTNDGGFTAQCKVTVKKGAPEEIDVTSVMLNKNSLTLQKDGSETLSAVVQPENATDPSVRWSSSDTAVATVDENGKVTAISKGTAVISATTVDGGFIAQCNVTVEEDTPEVVAVENVGLDKKTLTVDIGESEKLTATVKPDNAANKNVTWSSNDEDVASVDANGRVTAISRGTATITVRTEDGNFAAQCKVTVTDPDATSTDTETKPDGSTVTTVEDVNGSSSSTTVDTNGVVDTSVTLSDAAVSDATKNDTAVILPMVGVTATKDMNTAPSVTVDLPGSAPVQVEIPVLDMTPGTVAVLVDENGNETILKNSVIGNNGLIVTLSDGDTVKILDNTQSYSDVVASHWAKDNIDYVASRGLFVGVDDANFAPETSMTRAMIVSVLQRYAGDTTAAAPGSDWYEGARQWAIAHGISDGTNMNGNVTREQLVTMLYRYIGSPQIVGSLNSYSDNASVSPYAEQAMVWAVRNGIIGGMTADTLAPQGLATRAQVAAILERFIAWEQA